MGIEALEGLTDRSLFDDANSDEAPTETVVAEPAAEVVEQSEQTRDEGGRFAAKADDAPAPVAEEPAARAPVDDNAAMVPSWRVREINDEKRVLADRLAALEAEKPKWQQPQTQQSPAKEPEKVVKPDPLLDPEGYESYIEQKVEAKILNDRREASLENAHGKYGKEFEEAYSAAQKQIDPVLKMKMQSSRNPGETLIEWHREQKTRAEVGTDPNAYFDKRLAEHLKDPANQAKVLEFIRGGVQQPGARQASPVNLPPSLTRATSAAANASADDDDVSDEGLWRSANS